MLISVAVFIPINYNQLLLVDHFQNFEDINSSWREIKRWLHATTSGEVHRLKLRGRWPLNATVFDLLDQRFSCFHTFNLKAIVFVRFPEAEAAARLCYVQSLVWHRAHYWFMVLDPVHCTEKFISARHSTAQKIHQLLDRRHSLTIPPEGH